MTASTGLAGAQTPVWQTIWTGDQVPAANAFSSNAVFAANGDGLIGIDRELDTQLVRVSPTGQVRWGRSISSYGAKPFAMLPGNDNSAVFTEIGGFLGKLDGNGDIAWLARKARPGYPLGAARGPDGNIVTVRCTADQRMVVDAVQDATGAVSWQTSVTSFVGDCASQAVTVDASGNVYAYIAGSNAGRLAKLSPGGTVAWVRDADANQFDPVLVAAPDVVYLLGDGGADAFRTDTGALSWHNAAVSGYSGPVLRIPFCLIASDLVVSIGTSVTRLAAADGHTLWTAGKSGSIVDLAHARIGTTLAAVEYQTGSASLLRIDGDSGALLGSSFVGESSAVYDTLAVGVLDASHFGVLANYGGGDNPPIIAAVDAGTGAVSITPIAPLAPIAASSESRLMPGGDIVGVAAIPQYRGNGIATRRLRASDGQPLWQTITASTPAFTSVTAMDAAGTATTTVSVLGLTANFVGPAYVEVNAFDAGTGSLRWTRRLQDAAEYEGQISAPQFDTAGNVVIAISSATTFSAQCQFQYCYSSSILKLSAATGTTLWRRDSTYASLRAFAVVGDAVLASGVFDTSPDPARAVLLASADGTPQWRTAAIVGADRINTLDAIDAGHVLVGSNAGTADQWSRVDVATHAISWTTTPTLCTQACDQSSRLLLQDGSLLLAGQRRNDRAAWVAKIHADGSGASEWFLTSPTTGSYVRSMTRDGSGALLRLSRAANLSGLGGLNTLMHFDPSSMTGGPEQAMSGLATDIWGTSAAAFLTGRTDATHIATNSYVQGGDGYVGDADNVFDDHVQATGDLSASVSTDRASVGAGAPVHFVVTLHYTGGTSLSGVGATVTFPPHRGLHDASCTAVMANSCVLDTRTSNVHATFATAAGGSVQISGTFEPAPEAESATTAVRAAVFGPIGLSESNMVNNQAAAPVLIGLFGNGFD